MAEVEIEAFNALRRLLAAVSTEAVAAADEAAAEVYLSAASAAAPVAEHESGSSARAAAGERGDRPGGPSKLLSSQQGNIAHRIFVGPTKKKGFYGYFLERGWTATGPKRRARTATATTHSQRE